MSMQGVKDITDDMSDNFRRLMIEHCGNDARVIECNGARYIRYPMFSREIFDTIRGMRKQSLKPELPVFKRR